MNAPLAQLVLSRVTEAARHSSRLRRALRRRAYLRIIYRSGLPARDRIRGNGAWLVASRWTIGPRGVLP